MALDKDIVVVAKYSRKVGGKVTRGSTPGRFVVGYMARKAAVEPLNPIKGPSPYITRYMARSDAVEALIDTARYSDEPFSIRGGKRGRPTLRQRRLQRSARRMAASGSSSSAKVLMGKATLTERFRDGVGDGGVAFGPGEISLSHEGLHRESDYIQELFDAGHTVTMAVLSFDHEYLRRHGLVPETMLADDVRPGDYRGQLDQMKLRSGVMAGLHRMASRAGFDDMRYVGVIQVDTAHVHAHLVLTDAGASRRRRAHDGSQRGKLSKKEMMWLRTGIEDQLDRSKHLAHMSSAISREKQSTVSYLKSWAVGMASLNDAAQHVLSLLPADTRLWRAGSSATSMRRPLRLVRDMVEEHLARPESPMPQAMVAITEYADMRAQRESLTATERQRLIDEGRRRVVDGGINAVLRTLAAVPEDVRQVRTRTMDLMAQDLSMLGESMASMSSGSSSVRARDGESASPEATMEQFTFRLRSYQARLEHHRVREAHFRARLARWEEEYDQGVATEESRAMADFYAIERDYHARGLAKYQHLLAEPANSPAVAAAATAVDDYGLRLANVMSMRADASLARMRDADAAEEMGREVYGQHGGGTLTLTGDRGVAARAAMDRRIVAMRRRYAELVETLRGELARTGAQLVVGATAREEVDQTTSEQTWRRMFGGDDPASTATDDPATMLTAVAEPEFDFSDVRGVDLQDLRWDWVEDRSVGRLVARRHAELTRARASRLESAVGWMRATGHSREEMEEETAASAADIMRAMEMAHEVGTTSTLPSAIAARAAEKAAQRDATVEVDESGQAWHVRPTVRLDDNLAPSMWRQCDATVAREALEYTEVDRDAGDDGPSQSGHRSLVE